MPIFEYRCQGCGHAFERITRNPAEQESCPVCRHQARRVVSAPAGGTSAAGEVATCSPRGGFT